MRILPINLDDLIHARSVESVRREFKKTWSDQILDQSLRSICAFANDFFNLNGGYLIIGIQDHNGLPVLPPHGLDDQNLEKIQKQIRGGCKRIDPEYQPVISPEIYSGKQILVVWCPAGDTRPYQAPITSRGGERAYYVRQGSETIEARGDVLTQLMQMTAKVPFDDRRNLSATIETISPTLVRNFLDGVRSDLVSPNVSISDLDLYRHLRLLIKMNGHEVPRNVALLFFTHDPENFFAGARIEVTQFDDSSGGDVISERVFRGPLHTQLKQALDYLKSSITTTIKKLPDQAESLKFESFPYQAVEESLTNAIYHRGYENIGEPIKVYIYPDRMEIISYPGPMSGIAMYHLQSGVSLPPVPNRNRRIGEFLKELELAEARGTGIPKIRRKMKENGSPAPLFDFDEARSYFRVILLAHPEYVVLHTLRESAQLWAQGERLRAVQILERAYRLIPDSLPLLEQLNDYKKKLS
ncbi:MAG: putative DNA binding domain-containing protein [Chloroflexi bacterium]|nr:putative DNA binding domain-containing protein [Chloroflexota bacterium]MBI5714225.1 putative DNA binding domain-containing protein [Chloroflexota bacterium]